MARGGGTLAFVAIVLAAASAASAADPDWAEAFDRAAGDVVSPGTLAAGHTALEGISRCTECHGSLRGTPDDLCIACHESVAERIVQRVGVHGTFDAACATCHVEHRGVDADLVVLDRAGFNHDQARFALRGAHREAECGGCHDRAHPETRRVAFRHFGFASEDCADCHARDDPHDGAFPEAEDCAICHAEQSWHAEAVRVAATPDAPGFRHDRDTAFPLRGRHAEVACVGCHAEARATDSAVRPGADVPTGCAGCHEDPHERTLGADCGRCHTESDWPDAKADFDHATQTDFPLDALHAELSCERCHDDGVATFEVPGDECASCHPVAAELLSGRFGGLTAPPDPHAADVECRGCHPEASRFARLVDLERTCVECHDTSYAPLLVTRKRILDELLVQAEAGLADSGAGSVASDLSARRAVLEQLARSGLHHADLSELLLRTPPPAPTPETQLDTAVQVGVRRSQ